MIWKNKSFKYFNKPLSKAITIQQHGLLAIVDPIMIVFPSLSEATNGYFIHGYGVLAARLWLA
jgi:long-chain fatty acid transport protein